MLLTDITYNHTWVNEFILYMVMLRLNETEYSFKGIVSLQKVVFLPCWFMLHVIVLIYDMYYR